MILNNGRIVTFSGDFFRKKADVRPDESWSTYHFERSERLNGYLSTYHHERSESLTEY